MTFPLTVNNVAPTVTIDPAQAKTLSEGDVLQILGHFNDPGTGPTRTAARSTGARAR